MAGTEQGGEVSTEEERFGHAMVYVCVRERKMS